MSVLRRRALIEQGNNIPYWENITEDWDYIIDQTGIYDNPIIINEKNLYRNKLRSIANIRDMSKLVVGYYDEASAKLIWNPINNSSKTAVKCNTSAYPINMNISNYMKEHPTADVFMKLPEFWWRCWNINNNSDTVAFKFVTEEPTDGNTWNHWDGNIFIGVYKSGTNKVNDISVLRSVSGIPAYLSDSCDNYRSFARNKGAGYRCVTYEAHQIMALLFFGFYGHPNDNEIFGAITSSSYLDKMGTTDAIGIDKDDNVVVNDNMTTHSYWGLENWCRGNEEHIDNIQTLNYRDDIVKIRILSISSGVKVFFNAPVFNSYYYYISRLGMPELIAEDNGKPYLFKGLFKTGKTSGLGAIRNLQNGGGLVGLDISYPKNNAVTSSTSRLQYEGDNEQNTIPSSATSVISSYVLDQTDPNGNPNTAIVFDNDNSVILAIKAASDFYALENKAWGSSTPEFIKMSKTNKLKTTRGTTLDANNYDIFMKLPEFWWKCKNVNQTDDDLVRISFTMTNPNDDTWNHWDGKTFIGVYKASNYSSGNNSWGNNSWVRSRSGVQPNASHFYEYLKNKKDFNAKNRGNGFSYTTYEIHKVMCLLLWGYLANVNYPKIGIQRNVNSITGVNDDLGFEDNPDRAINLWGLEDWYGNGAEIIEDLRFDTERKAYYQYSNKIILVDNNNNVIRTIPQPSGLDDGSFYKVAKFRLREYGDVIPSNANNESKYSARFGVQYTSKIGERHIYYFVRAAQSYNNPTTFDSLFAGFTSNSTPFTPRYYNCRLCYKGNYFRYTK